MMRDIGAYFYYAEKPHNSMEITKTSAFNLSLMSQFSVHVYLTVNDCY